MVLVLWLSFLTIVSGWQFGPFVRPNDGPIISPNASAIFNCPLTPGPVAWQAGHTFNPAAIVRNGKINVLFRSEDNTGSGGIGSHVSRIGLAIAKDDDGVQLDIRPTPVLYPANDSQIEFEWHGGCEDPRIVECAEDGKFYIYYTQYSREHYHVGLGVASSGDLLTWEKHGPVFAKAYGGKYMKIPSKSGAVVTRVADSGDRLVAAKVDGKYWMYWGEGSVRIAWSDNLIDWTVVEEQPNQPLVVLPTRKGMFDSTLSEGGPPGIVTKDGIVVFYNGKNAGKNTGGDPSLADGQYSGGQALFSLQDPTKLLERPEKPFFKPERPWEKTGQYAAGTTFIEGLVLHQSKLHLYYGGADSYVGTAIAPFPETVEHLEQ
jgi:predicted GH43/DUF377 family glycosyl hydrolase